MTDKTTGAGLRGQSAGQTAICTVGAAGNSLRYRGYAVDDLADNASFNEVAHLILKGELPTAGELTAYSARLRALRGLPGALKEVLERIPASAHPMDVLRTGCSFLGNLEPETDFDQQQHVADRLLAAFPSMIGYWYRYSHDGVRIEVETDDDGIGGHFLHLLHGETPKASWVRAMHTSLVLYAEHEFNASTFAARVVAG
ncbi:MAG: citrate/2-methylcitrate synthase, partial [Wenzhouxiangella sp.]